MALLARAMAHGGFATQALVGIVGLELFDLLKTQWGCTILLGDRLRKLRESKQLSQGDIEKRTGLLRCYTSRVENGHTVPSVATLEKYARALDVPMYRLFCDGAATPLKLDGEVRSSSGEIFREANPELHPFIKLLARLSERERMLLMQVAREMASNAR